ncbi:hypothetical protein Tco_0489222 [Tanacetum coccineum]
MTYFCGMTNGREMTPPPGFLTLTPFPGPNASELPPITTSTFIVRTPKNAPLTNRASTSNNPDPMISPGFVKANYEVLESLLREDNRQLCNKDLRTELEYFSEECDEEREMELRPTRAHGLFADYTGCVTPFVHGIKDYPFLDGLKMPSHVGSYDEKGYPDNILHLFEGTIRMKKWAMPVACHMFTYTLKDSAQIWWNGQKADDTMQIMGLHEEQRISKFVHGLRTRSLVEFLSIDLPTSYKGLMEKTYTWIEAREVATNSTLNDRQDNSKRFKRNPS